MANRDKIDENPSFVSAGFPNPARESSGEPLDIQDYLIAHPASTFFMRVEGSLLVSQGVMNGDLLVVDKSLRPSPDDLVVVSLNDELHIKQYKKSSKGAFLASDDEKQMPITPDLDFSIWGIVISVIRKLH